MWNEPTTPEMDYNEETLENEVSLESFVGNGVDYSGQFEINRHFGTAEEATKWAKAKAISIGFEIVIGSHKNGGKTTLLTCARGVPYRGGVLQRLDGILHRKSKTKSCRCKFVVKVKQFHNGWDIIVFPGDKGKHNHAMAVYPEGHRQMSGLSPASKLLVKNLTAAHAKPSAILSEIMKENPNDNATVKHVYNYRDWLKEEGMEGRSVVGQLFHLAEEKNYIHFAEGDPETLALTRVFMVHPEAAKLLRSYLWFIGIDSTYKTNKYKMPLVEIVGMSPCNKNFLIGYTMVRDESEVNYRWVISNLRMVLRFEIEPTVIVTDRELGLMKPIRDFFPQSSHLLCTWHINKDVGDYVYKHCGKDKRFGEAFKNGRWRMILEAATKVEYKNVVENMKYVMKRYPHIITYLQDTWLVHKEIFVHAWTNNVCHFGNTTTCRVESAHVALKLWLSSAAGGLDTIFVKINGKIEAELASTRESLEHSARRAGVSYFGLPYNYLVCRVSDYCLGLIANELKRMRSLSVEVFERCGCVLPKTHGIPCACELKQLMDCETPINLQRIHVFLRTLSYGETMEACTEDGHEDE